MNKFFRFSSFYSLEVSIKLSQLISVHRMSTENSNINSSECSNIVINPDQNNQVNQSGENSVGNNIFCYNNSNSNCQPYYCYPNGCNFCYHPFYHNFFYPQPNNFSFPFYPVNNFYTYLHQQHLRQYYHRGSSYQSNFGERIMALRSWENISENIGVKPGFIFTLMSYNVLAQNLLEQHPYLYKRHDNNSLIWSTRWNNLFKEISRFKPDILCLQEVQESHLVDYYSLLEHLGYESVFKKRTGLQPDGCAIYYKVDNVSLVESSIVEYFKNPIVPLLNRDNVGIVMKFAPKLHPTREFVVATTHLLYNPRRDDVRMAQMQLLLTEVEKLSYKSNRKEYYLPAIITGDLNSPPHSDLYEFVTRGSLRFEKLSSSMIESHHKSNQKVLVTSSLGITDNSQYEKVLAKRKENSFNLKDGTKPKKTPEDVCNIEDENSCGDDRKLTHKFKFKSVYNHGETKCGEATTYQDEWLTVDYIFYSQKKGVMYPEDKLKLLSRYRLPTGPELDGITIPNNVLGSDHLALIAKFKLEF